MRRKGLAIGQGKGYRNILRTDAIVHSQSSRGVKQPQLKMDLHGRNKYNLSYMKNLEMNPDTYRLRRQVIDIIYGLKQKVDLPRIEVRITEKNEKILGGAWMNKCKHDRCIIWISKESVQNRDLRSIVYHEILHTVYGAPHDSNDPLMNPVHEPLTKEKADELFIQWVKKLRQGSRGGKSPAFRCWNCGASMKSHWCGDKSEPYEGCRGVLCYKCGKADKNRRFVGGKATSLSNWKIINWALYDKKQDAQKQIDILRKEGHDVQLRKTKVGGYKYAIYIKKDWSEQK
jgi:hypothetical protein